MNVIPMAGPYRYTHAGTEVFHLPLARPWTWALTHHGMWSVFVHDVEPARQGVPERRHPLHPPPEVLGSWLAIYATRDYDAGAVAWLRKAHDLEAPAGDVLPAGAYVAMARLAEVSTVGNDSRCASDPWWWHRGAPCRGTVAWWLEEVMVFEPLVAAPAPRLSRVDRELLPELRERVRLARDGVWHPEAYAVPAALPAISPEPVVPPAAPVPLPTTPAAPPPRQELPADNSPVAPMGAVEQLGLFGEPPPRLVHAIARENPAPTPAPPPPALPPPDGPSSLEEGAARIRALLGDGAWHDMTALLGAAGQDEAGRTLLYRVTCPAGAATLLVHQVPVILRGDGQGGCWYASPGTPAYVHAEATHP
ncbi:hypothetical protein [Myxococcus eversor]|uniref:hypothetical protein n=1 Tax=Myxococcus eversor TaxID=2709661 RepID=UPI00196809FB|nr:hypothetical protein [Myxococcus eversor]